MGLLALANGIIEGSFGLIGLSGITLEKILGWIFSPLAWIMGVPWKDCSVIGQFMGEKTVLNEFVAYLHFAQYIRLHPDALEPRSVIIATYALCGFAHVASLAIFIGGISAIAPKTTHTLSRIGIKALIAATLACLMTACIAGTFFIKGSIIFGG